MKILLEDNFSATKRVPNTNKTFNPLNNIQNNVEETLSYLNVINTFNNSNIINNQSIPTEINIKIKSLTAWDNFLLNVNKQLTHFTHNNINKPSQLYEYLSKHNFWFINTPIIDNVFHPVSSKPLLGQIQFNLQQDEKYYPKHDLYKLISRIGFNNALNLSLLHELGHIINAFTDEKQNKLFFQSYLDKNSTIKTSKENPFFKNYSETFSDLYAILSLNIIDKNDITNTLKALREIRQENLSIQYSNSFILEKIESLGLEQYKNMNSFSGLNQIINQLCLENVENTIKEKNCDNEKDISEFKDKFLKHFSFMSSIKDKRKHWHNLEESNNNKHKM
jgi:hypothetical protein